MKDQNESHESFKRDAEVPVGSPRAFGIVFCIVFALIALWPLSNGSSVHIWAVSVSSLLLAITLTKPNLLQPLNRLWFQFGMLLHKIVSPIVMAFLFFATVTPIAIIFRLIGKDPLNRDPEPDCESYWITRDPKTLTPESMKNQF